MMQTSALMSTNDLRIEVLRIDDRVVDVREDLELVGRRGCRSRTTTRRTRRRPARTCSSTNGSIIWCSSAMRVIHVSGLMDMSSRRRSPRRVSGGSSASTQRQQDAQDDRRRQRKVEREVAAPDVEVAGQPAERHAQHHQQPERRRCRGRRATSSLTTMTQASCLSRPRVLVSRQRV